VVRPLRGSEHHDQHVVSRTDLLESIQKVIA